MTEASPRRASPPPRAAYLPHIIALVSSLAITAVILMFREELTALQSYGYLGVFLISLLGNATVILPVPSLAVVFAGGGIYNPLLVGIVAGLGQPLGELTGYLAGFAGSAIVQDNPTFERIRTWVEKRAFLTLFVLSAIPNPVMDLAGMAAGMAKYPVARFLLPCWLGKTAKSVAVAYLGSFSLDWFSGLFG
jgi:uncharacterized membrane protein YdjX (TVP38/TMEM64 family)